MKHLSNPSFRPSRSLRNKLLVMIIPLMIIVFALIISINFIYQIRNGEAAAANTLSLVADQLANNIQSWLVRYQNQVTLTAENPLIQQGTTQIIENGPDALTADETITKYLQTMLRNFPAYDEIYGLSPAGRILFSTDPARVGETRPVDNLINQPLQHGGVYFQDAYLAAATKIPCVAYSVAVNNPDGQPVAVLVFQLEIRELLASITQNEYHLGNTGQILLLRSDRTVINQPHNEPDFQLSFRSNVESAFRAVKGEQGVLRGPDHDNEPVLAAYNYIPYSKWGIVVQQDWAELMQPVWRSTVLMTLPGLGSLVLLILLVSFFISQTVAPLQEVVRVSIALTAGDFGQRIHMRDRDDEIGVLGRAFNQMAVGLQAQFNVQERLQQLLEVLVSTIRLGPLVNLSLATIARNYGMSVGAIYLLAEETNTLSLVATYCPSGKLSLKQELPADEGPGGQALSSRRPVVMENIPVDTVYTTRTITGNLLPTCIFHLPILFGDQTIGLMVLASISKPQPDCLDQLQSASALLAVSLHNSLMFGKVEALSEKLSRTNEELSITNEELQSQTEELQSQTEELRIQAEELHAKEQELISANQQLEQASQMKSDFLARMSHELRTPLNTVIGFCEILLEGVFGNLNAKQQEYLKDILSSGRHLLFLINDILDLSKIEAGREELSLGQIDPIESLQGALVLTWAQAERKQLQIGIRFSPGQYKVLADAEKLKQIFVNLLSNAIKFSPIAGHIIATAEPDAEQLAISLSDQGIGIAPELHQVIFDKFRQGKPRPDSTQQGTGLGLAITKKLVEMHGGRIWVDSNPGFGATFTFTLPMVDHDNNIKEIPASNLSTEHMVLVAQSDPATVLVVDDDPKIVEYLAAVLESANYRVSRATSGREAIEAVLSTPPDILILDLAMPELTGFDVLDKLSKHPGASEVCIFVLTAKDLTTAEKNRLNSQVFAIARKGELSKDQFLAQLEKIKKSVGGKENSDENSHY